MSLPNANASARGTSEAMHYTAENSATQQPKSSDPGPNPRDTSALESQPATWLHKRPNMPARHDKDHYPATVPGRSVSDSDGSSSSAESETDSEQEEQSILTAGQLSARPRPGLNFPQKTRYNGNPLSKFSIRNDSMSAKGKVSKRDGRLHISVRDAGTRIHLANLLAITTKHHLGHERVGRGRRGQRAKREVAQSAREQHVAPPTRETSPSLQIIAKKQEPRPKLNIVIMVIGSRGDIQPFIKVGKILKDRHGHRVRIATHPAFKDFVETDCGLEFFSVGGDPSELMAFMVKNPGLIPSVETLRKGEVGRRRAQMAEMFEGFWRACIEPSDGLGQHNSEETPFIADAIIANPPSFAHVHCAERLGCPLHIMFTFPYTPTQQFPHPLANIRSGNVDASYTNFMSYPLVEMMTWQGLGDLVNDLRVKTLGLDPVSTIWAPGRLYRLKVPYTYMWSPGLVPKPADWGSEICIAGFAFLDLASNFKPPKDLEDFLNAGEPPIYIGFGSIVLEHPEDFTKMIFAAIKAAGVRAVLNKGWGGFGSNEDTPEYIHMLGNTPHDWLFPRCSAVVHHGGAGTTAIGLKCAKPTMIVPFFGDQQFWGSMVAAAKAGAHECIPHKQLTTERFTKGIKQCLTEEARVNVQKIADSIDKEGDGAETAVDAFHASLPMQGDDCMRCSVLQDRAAVWQMRHSKLRLSALAAELLVQQKKISYSQLRLRRQYDWNDFQGSGGPITGGTSAIFKGIAGFGRSFGEGPSQSAKHVTHRVSHQKRKAMHKKHKQERRRALQATEPRAPNETNMALSARTDHTASSMSSLPNNSTGKPTKITQELKCDAQRSASAVHNEAIPSPQQAVKDDKHDKQSRQDCAQSENGRYNHTASSKAPRPPNEHHDTTATSATVSTQLSADPSEPLAREIARDAGVGILAPAAALIKLPMDLFVGVADGFHNLPRLYGDATVRRPVRISGFYSGLRAARNELTYGTWDALTGVLTQPYQGLKEDGVIGLASGIGKGLGGLVLKECAAIIGPFGYTMKGVHRELTKRLTPVKDMRHKRMKQGQLEVDNLSPEQREQAQQLASRGWKIMADAWAEGERIKSGAWDPQTGEVKGKRESDQNWTMRIPGSKWVVGAVGRIKYEREKEAMVRHGAFENVEAIEKAIQARKQGYNHEEAVIKSAGAETKTK